MPSTVARPPVATPQHGHCGGDPTRNGTPDVTPLDRLAPDGGLGASTEQSPSYTASETVCRKASPAYLPKSASARPWTALHQVGDPEADSLVLRFWRKVRCPPHTDCWPWTGARWPGGYGQIIRRLKGRWRPDGAHRLSYEIHVGPVPDGMQVCHSCDMPSCVNPGHLFLGTQLDNMRDRYRKGWFLRDRRAASLRAPFGFRAA